MRIDRSLILDATCEIRALLLDWTEDIFWDFSQCEIRSDRIYVIGRTQFRMHKDLIRELAEKGVRMIFANPFEGSETLYQQIQACHMQDLFQDQRMLLISGGHMPADWPYMLHEHFLTKIHDFNENLAAASRTAEIFLPGSKPYDFLFLNGRGRAHRKWMIEWLAHQGLLDKALYSWLDPSSRARRDLRLVIAGEDLMQRSRPLQLLPHQYEIPRYRDRLSIDADSVFAKYELFNHEWGEIYIQAEQYIDTYFSVVTETVHAWPHSFRTEKIWKPMAMGHPWICVANQGFYQDLRHLGFQTFDGIIDENFDSIHDNTARLHRVCEVIKDVCRSGAAQFMMACETVCKYNQQHMTELRRSVLDNFSQNFWKFLRKHQWTI